MVLGIATEFGGDATNSWIKYNVPFTYPIKMDNRLKDKFEMNLADDMSGLDYFRVFVRGYKEIPNRNVNV